jgi:hypothetical protein
MDKEAVEAKDQIIDRLGRADNCAEARQVISYALTSIRVKNPYSFRQMTYVNDLCSELLLLCAADFDYTHWCNIRCAILYLEEIKTEAR